MAFQINEKMMAHDRAIITRNKTERDLLKDDALRFKPGMAHYISENQKLLLSIEPRKLSDNSVRKFLEIITDVRLSQTLLDYVNRDGGSNNSMKGPLHSTVNTGTAPFVIASTTRVDNLNADMVDNKHVDDSKVSTNYLWTSKKIDDSKAPRGFGLGTDINKVSSNDCNNISGTGFFSIIGTPINGAEGEEGDAIIQQYISSSGVYQTIEYLRSKNMYSRIKLENAWTNWDKAITRSNILNEGINIVTQASQPTNITNENTYWYEIVQ